jgi:pyruvate/2-oxoglutarate dehydrogenase complex dihydrolipoamide dehydrogenase (E3) component
VNDLARIEPFDEHNRRLLALVRPPDWANPTPKPKYDLVVIGGGTAGLVSAMGAAGLGARVAIVERALLGGDCLNTGCVPSKALLRSARAVHEAREATAVGVHTTTEVDFAAVMARVRERRADIAHHDSAARLASSGVDVFLGQASFCAPDAVVVEGRTLHFRRAVIATGGRPTIPAFLAGRKGPPYENGKGPPYENGKGPPYEIGKGPPYESGEAAPFLTSETVFSLTEQPRELIVLGAGPIGCEMAQAFALLGTRVTLIDAAPRILPHEDADASAILARRLDVEGVRIVTGEDVTSVTTTGSGRIAINLARRDATGELLLVAIGRTPNVDGLDLAAAGVAHGPEGVQVNDRLQTSNPRIYAAGDVCSRFKFTHAADAMARFVIQNALFFGRRRASALVIPWCTYTFPEVAHVGLPSEEARGRATSITINLGDVDRAVVDEETDGFLRVHHRNGAVIAATMVAPHAGEVIGQVASLMRRGARLDELSSEVFPYPTVAEALRKAGDAYRRTRLTPGVRSAFERYFRLARRW